MHEVEAAAAAASSMDACDGGSLENVNEDWRKRWSQELIYDEFYRCFR
jgi:hypothetical protein